MRALMRVAHVKKMAVLLAGLVLAGCSSHSATHRSHHGFASAATDPFAGKGSPIYKGAQIPFGGGEYQVGNAYQVAGRWYTPREQPGYDKTGVASWYGEAFHRRKTSNGEWFDMNTLTAAHATLPLPSYALVTNLDNNRQVVVRINDRGPFVGSRVIDLSKRAADELGYRARGKAHVRVKLIGPAPSDDSMAHMLAMNDAMHRGASMNQLVAMSNDVNAAAPATAVAAAQPKALPFAKAAPQAQVQQAQYTPPAPAQMAYIVRVGVYHDLGNASTAYQQLQSFGPTRIVKAVGANGPLYRVEMGPLDNQADGEAALNTALGEGFEGARLVTTEPLQISMK
ncbi:MAG: septal ring lytic transglycosylase RlpA family protein [Alphaproteobacteria bacterium]|nr:septal ring lytic transglycosylase RlpA family protein [Alphaproteobacteria bacterium]